MPSDGAQLNSAAAAVIDDFGSLISVSDVNLKSVRTVLAGSAYLTQQLNTASACGDLAAIDILVPGSNLGGAYTADTRRMAVSPVMLDDPVETAFVLGHETQHALNRRQVDKADQRFQTELVNAATGDRNYTAATEQMIKALREDEARANLAGWNAMIDYLHDQHPGLTLTDVARETPRTADFLHRTPSGRVRLRPDLTADRRMQFDFTPDNVEAMGRAYFDKPPHQARLGRHGNSDYANRYGAWIVGAVAECDRHHHPKPSRPLRLDLARCGLRRDLMEQNGIDFGSVDHEPMACLDASTEPAVTEHLHHTAHSHPHQPDLHQSDHQQQSTALPPFTLAGLSFAQRPVRPPRTTAPTDPRRLGDCARPPVRSPRATVER